MKRIRFSAGLFVVTSLLVGSQVQAQTRVDFHLLPAVSTGPLDPEWSPDNRFLAYAARGDIWTVSDEGERPSPLRRDLLTIRSRLLARMGAKSL